MGDLGKLIVAKGFKKLSQSPINRLDLVTLLASKVHLRGKWKIKRRQTHMGPSPKVNLNKPKKKLWII